VKTQKTQEQLQTELDAEYDAFQTALDRGLWAGDFREAKRLLEHVGDGLPKNLSSNLEECLFRFAKDGSHDLAYYEWVSSGRHLRTLPFRGVIVNGKSGKLFDTHPNSITGKLWCVVAFPDGTVDHNVQVQSLEELVTT
jgi:hypothetical protein